MAAKLTPAKARKILAHGKIGDKPLTMKQRRMLRAVAAGQKPRTR
jgi:hypothetical protein